MVWGRKSDSASRPTVLGSHTPSMDAGLHSSRTATWLTHLEFDWGSPVWRHWLAGLAEHHLVLRYDERGCGLSDRDVEDFSLDARVADLEAVVDAAGIERLALLGMSQGVRSQSSTRPAIRSG